MTQVIIVVVMVTILVEERIGEAQLGVVIERGSRRRVADVVAVNLGVRHHFRRSRRFVRIRQRNLREKSEVGLRRTRSGNTRRLITAGKQKFAIRKILKGSRQERNTIKEKMKDQKTKKDKHKRFKDKERQT